MHATTFSVALARRLNDVTINGKKTRMHRYPVRIETVNTLSRTFATVRLQCTVISHSAAAAANYARSLRAWPACTTITVRGPRGGDTVRYIGWESAVWRDIMDGHGRKDEQLQLPGL